MRARWLMWIVVAIVSFLWASTVLGVAVRLADHGVAAWWVVLPFGLLPFAGLLILGRRDSLRRAAETESPTDPAAEAVLGSAATAGAMIESLTPRESEVLLLMEQGHTNRQIAQQLYISGATVKSHVNAICRKLQAENRTQAVAIARREGLLER